jgi:enterochelin esterase-like enzyme
MSRPSTASGSGCFPDVGARRPWLALGLAGLVLAASVLTGSLWHELPARFAGRGSFGWPALEAGRWWTLASSLLLTRNIFMAVTMAAAVAAGLGIYERRAGPGRALAVALVGHVTGSVVVALGAGALGRTGWPVAERAAANLDYGASMVVAAALGAMASRSRDRRLLRLALFGPPLVLLLHHQLADWAHLVACPAGYLVDGARRPRPAAVAAFATAALTGWLVLYGPQAVVDSTNEIRFAHAPATGLPLALSGASRARPVLPQADEPARRGRLERLAYTAKALGDRPAVATLYVPAQLDTIVRAGGRVPVVVFLHGIPGAPEDWLAGGNLGGRLDEETAAGRFPVALAVVPESATMHDPKAGWVDAPHQPVLRSLRTDLLPAVARRFPAADLDVGHMAVVGVGRGANGALRLARLDRRFGFTVAIRSATGNRWAYWRSELPKALRALTDAGFGATQRR